LHTLYPENETKIYGKKRQDIVQYTQTNQDAKFGAVLAMFNFSQKSLMPFFHQTLQLVIFRCNLKYTREKRKYRVTLVKSKAEEICCDPPNFATLLLIQTGISPHEPSIT